MPFQRLQSLACDTNLHSPATGVETGQLSFPPPSSPVELPAWVSRAVGRGDLNLDAVGVMQIWPRTKPVATRLIQAIQLNSVRNMHWELVSARGHLFAGALCWARLVSLHTKTTEIIIGGKSINAALFFLPSSVITKEPNLLHCYGPARFVVLLHRFPSRSTWGIPGCGLEEAVPRASRGPAEPGNQVVCLGLLGIELCSPGKPRYSSLCTSTAPVVGELGAAMLAKSWLHGSRLKAGPGFCTPCGCNHRRTRAVLDGIQLGRNQSLWVDLLLGYK